MSIRRRKVLLLGSTGSIGCSTLEVARQLPDRMELVGLAAATSAEKLARQAQETGVAHVCLTEPAVAEASRSLFPDHVTLHKGEAGLLELVEASGADMVLVAIVGTAGLGPALKAMELGMDLAVASKEILVMAGETVMETAKRKGVHVLPVDSEHNAIFQCLDGRQADDITRLILTASGGPFRTWTKEEIATATVEQALRHPTWEMGRKITIDSATLFNKGLEMIEARWLFGVAMDQVEVIVHPQSIIHSMVEFRDHSVLAQLSHSDMCFPIQYAVTWPDRVGNSLAPLHFGKLGSLTFEEPRRDDFPALDLAHWAGKEGGTLPSVLNAANEVAVQTFLEKCCDFPTITRLVQTVMERHQNQKTPSLADILDADNWARREAAALART
jgi:1-deoxy-D-xylulose-5-phosphate reductoisomerase